MLLEVGCFVRFVVCICLFCSMCFLKRILIMYYVLLSEKYVGVGVSGGGGYKY